MKQKRILLLVVVILLTSLACGLSQSVSQQNEDSSSVDKPTQEESGGIFSDIGKKEVNSQPVSLNKGLSSLDYYRMTIEVELIGPSQQDVMRIKSTMESAQPQDASFLAMENYSMSSDDPEADTNISYIWTIGNDRCTGSDEPDDYSFDTSEPDAKEMADLVRDLFDMNFMIEDPQFVGEESMNGIQTNHFTFQLSGLGVESGATVLANQGEYWLAVDGDYMVRYSLLVQTSSSPEKINHLKVFANLEEVNVPRTISMPQACYDAQNNEE